MILLPILFFIFFVYSNMQPISVHGDEVLHKSNSNKLIKLADESDRLTNDLETAAGSNVLRPLFVYRQQVASRERLRKAGARRLFVDSSQT